VGWAGPGVGPWELEVLVHRTAWTPHVAAAVPPNRATPVDVSVAGRQDVESVIAAAADWPTGSLNDRLTDHGLLNYYSIYH